MLDKQCWVLCEGWTAYIRLLQLFQLPLGHSDLSQLKGILPKFLKFCVRLVNVHFYFESCQFIGFKKQNYGMCCCKMIMCGAGGRGEDFEFTAFHTIIWIFQWQSCLNRPFSPAVCSRPCTVLWIVPAQLFFVAARWIGLGNQSRMSILYFW